MQETTRTDGVYGVPSGKKRHSAENEMMKKPDIIIGIDPDTDKSGVAIVRTAGREVEVLSNSFPELLDFLVTLRQNALLLGVSVVVVVEASWKISTNWHIKRGDNARMIAQKGKDTGRCHEVGRKIVECARYFGLEVIEQLPLKKIWKGKDGKITDEEIKAFIPIKGRTNQEQRDAALLAWNEAEFPIRIITKTR
jgi:hypothetical protein